MDADRIRSLRLAEPFKPFRLMLDDGRSFEVRRPFDLAMAQNNSRVLIVTGRDTAVWFAPRAVKEIELLTAAEASGAAAT